MTVFLNLNTSGWDSMGGTISLPNDGEKRHAVLNKVAVGDEVITLDDDHLRLLSVVHKAAYDDTRIRNGKPVAVRAVDMTRKQQCKRLTREQVREILWQHQPECLLHAGSFKYDAWLIELNPAAAAALKAAALGK